MNDQLFEKYFVDLRDHVSLSNITEQLHKIGLVTVEGVDSPEKMIGIAERLGNILVQDDTDKRGLKIQHWPEKGEGSFYHTDRASMVEPPNIIFVVCTKQASEDGYSIFVDGKELYKALKKDHPEITVKFFEPEIMIFGLTPPHISAGSIFNKSENGSIFLKFRYDNKGAYFSPAILHYIPVLIEYIHKLSFSFRLQENQGYLVQNGRWLHGANPFRGERSIHRVILHSTIKSLSGEGIGFGFKEE